MTRFSSCVRQYSVAKLLLPSHRRIDREYPTLRFQENGFDRRYQPLWTL